MTRSKLILGVSALLLAGASAFASSAMRTAQTVYFEVSPNVAESTIIDFSCPIGDPGCLGVDGQSEGKQLYADEALTLELESE